MGSMKIFSLDHNKMENKTSNIFKMGKSNSVGIIACLIIFENGMTSKVVTGKKAQIFWTGSCRVFVLKKRLK